MTTLTIAFDAATYGKSLETLKTRDAGLASAQTAFALMAVAGYVSKAKSVDAIIEDACNVTGSRGAPTKDNPKGKANPNAIKANGYSGMARVLNLLRKADKESANADVVTALHAFIGHIANADEFAAFMAADDRVVKALETGDETALAKAETRFRANYLTMTYGQRPDTFAALERAVNKAIADAKGKPEESSDTPSEGEGEGEDESTLSPAATVSSALSLAELAGLLAERLADATAEDIAAADGALADVMAALRNAYAVAADAEAVAAAA